MEDSQNEAESLAQESLNKLTFEKLTPIHLSHKEMQGYTEGLNFVFQEEDLLNIAITGPYASGKSSVIKTYEENHIELNGIHISLSYFSPTLESKIKGQKKDNELAFEDELMLERKIINQIIHQIDPDKIPATEFKVKSESKRWTKITWTSIISLIIFCFIYIKEIWFTALFNEHPVVTSILIALSLIFIIFVTYKVIELQDGKNIIKTLKIFENEIDISTSSYDVSYFDKYLNEIIYILDKSKLDYIVFEDIDRYDDNLILNKLRELNYIYNKKQTKNKPKPIKFIYLIKDEIFESKERTKFFDYILPIIPVMDNSNSLGKMEELFKTQNIFNDFSTSFLDTISLYLDDIRLIKNICNEYIIYKNKLTHDASWFKNENLLAIIVYKNIFPVDFSLTRLGLGQGVVHRIIESLTKQKSKIYKTQIEKINNEIKLRKEKINIIETNHLKNLDELDALYINIRQCISINVNDNYFVGEKKISSLNQKEFIQDLKANNKLINTHSINDYYYNSYNQQINCEKCFIELETNTEYRERKKEIEIITTNKKSLLEEEIKKLEREKSQLKSPKKIIQIFTLNQVNSVTIDSLFELHIGIETEDTKEKEKYERYKAEYKKLSSSCYFSLLRVLIMQGYIDEYYSDYTSFFDEQGLSKNDTLFLRNINENINTEWELELKRPEIVLKRLNLDNSNNYTEYTVLNYSLLDYILFTNNTKVLYRFITLLKSHFETDFVNEYLARYYALLINQDIRYKPKYLCLLINALNIQFWNIWKFINIFDQKLYLYLSFIHNQPTESNKMKEGDDLKNFIEHSTDFLLIYDEWKTIFELFDEIQSNSSKIIKFFIELNIKFKKIDNSTPELLKLVEINNTYQLNYINVKYILENKYNLTNFDSHVIQIILALNDDAPIKLYFQSNPEALVSSITESVITTIDDSEETVIYVLNNNMISSSTKASYINKLSTTIKKLCNITDSVIWDELLTNQRIEYSAENIVFYFFNYTLERKEIERKINEKLADFINKNIKNISSSEANLNHIITDNDDKTLFFNQLVINTDLENPQYNMLISWFNGKSYDNFTYKNIDKEKMSILIRHRAIKLREKQNINFLRNNYTANILELIMLNFNEYINKLKSDNSLVKHNEIVRLLSEELTLTQKKSLLNLTKEPIPIKYSEYSEDIQKYIFEHNFDFDDLTYITNHSYYNSAKYDIKVKVKELCIKFKTQTLKIDKICYELLIELFTFEDFSLENKYILLTNQINHLELEQTYKCFAILENNSTNDTKFSRLFTGKNPRFEIIPLNTNMMRELGKKWKFSYRLEKGKILTFGKKLIKN